MLQQQITNLHKEREGRGSNPGPEQPGSVLETSRVWKHVHSTTPLHRDGEIKSLEEEPSSELDSGALCHTPKEAQGAPGSSQPLRGVGKGKECSERRGGRARVSGTHGPASPAPVPLHCVLVEMKTNRSAGRTTKSCKQLGLLTHMCRLFVRKGPLSGGQGTGESPCGVRVSAG